MKEASEGSKSGTEKGRSKVSLRVIPTSVHGVIDYLASGALYATPALLGLGDVPASARTLQVVPMPAHLTLDVASGALIAASPWLLGFAENGQRYWLPHALMGASEVLIALMSKTR